jgi:hypothetical protein
MTSINAARNGGNSQYPPASGKFPDLSLDNNHFHIYTYH